MAAYTAKWIRELSYFAGVSKTFVIEGNIHDKYFIPREKDGQVQYCTLTLDQMICEVFKRVYANYQLVYVDPLDQFDNRQNASWYRRNEDKAVFTEVIRQAESKQAVFADDNSLMSTTSPVMMPCVSQIRLLLTQTIKEVEVVVPSSKEKDKAEKRQKLSVPPYAVVFDLPSRLLASSQLSSGEEVRIFNNLYNASISATTRACQLLDSQAYLPNTLILLVDKLGDIPSWFYLNNPHVRTITIPDPDRETRKIFITSHFSRFANQPQQQEKLIDMTDGFKLIELEDLEKLYELKGEKIQHVDQIISAYRYGLTDDIWAQHKEALMDKPLRDGGTLQNRFEQHVKGQSQAVQKVVQVLRRTVMGLSGLQHSSSSQKPRSVLFFAGPTGTGKTETVKAVARLLYHDENAIVRFDMSEYEEAHSAQKLFGAPPGYVGYANGGQLTNAIRANPHAILLFDEIEKAAPSIMDKFLQVLEDGRMTDGQGKTVSFSDTIIFFTSNIGMHLEKQPETYEEICDCVRKAMAEKFKPEVRSRIGADNVVIFDYIHDDVARLILEGQLKRISANFCQRQRITLQYEAILAPLLRVWQNHHRSEGGRGIGNVVESCFLNQLAEYLFVANHQEGSTIKAVWHEDHVCFQPADE